MFWLVFDVQEVKVEKKVQKYQICMVKIFDCDFANKLHEAQRTNQQNDEISKSTERLGGIGVRREEYERDGSYSRVDGGGSR